MPSEQVVVPGVFGPGRAQDAPGAGLGSGAPATPVPYESVYAAYRAAALSQVDRELVPEQVRELLLRYFVGVGR